MTDTLLQTKLFVPRPRPPLMARPALLAKLDEALAAEASFARRLTLLNAPAGSGKTTLVAQWVNHLGDEVRVGWLTLDQKDAKPHRFLAYLLAVLQKTVTGLGSGAGQILRADGADLRPPALESILTLLLHDLAQLDERLLLILDDYQLAAGSPIDDILEFLVEQAPERFHLVLLTGELPHLPLSRWRARHQALTLDANALRLDEQEALSFLRDVMEVAVTPQEAAALLARSEGRIAGLQLAALALREGVTAADVAGVLHGSDRHLLDYLTEEAVRRLPPDQELFLLQNSVVDRLTAPLCDAVTGRADSADLLARLEAANLFLVALDERGHWYRYHNLFRDFLRSRLQQVYPQQATALHQRAGAWHARFGEPAAAVQHLLAAGDDVHAAQVLAAHAGEWLWQGDVDMLRHWLQELPAGRLADDPRLSLADVWVRLLSGDFDDLAELEPLLAAAEIQLQPARDAEAEALLPELDTLRAVIAVEGGDTSGGLALAERAWREVAVQPDTARRQFLESLLQATLGRAYRDLGQTRGAIEAYEAALKVTRRAGKTPAALAAAYELGKLYEESGELRRAERVYRHAAELAEAAFGAGVTAVPPAGAPEIGLGRLAYRRNVLDEAARLLERGTAIAARPGGRGLDGDGLLALSLVLQAQGHIDEANDTFAAAEARARHSPRPDALLRLEPVRIRLWLAQGERAPVRQWAGTQPDDPEAYLAYPQEITGVALARAYLAQHDEALAERARRLLAALLPVVESGGRQGRVLEILLLLALAHEQLGDRTAALEALGRCLALAEPQGYVRLFLDQDDEVAKLLYAAAEQGIAPAYAARLLVAFGHSVPAHPQAPEAIVAPLVEPLSTRQRQVLGLMAEGLTNREIGQRLVLSPNTIKRHASFIYRKLSVHSRADAVRQGRELGILKLTGSL